MTPATGSERRVSHLPAREIHQRLAGLRRHTARYHDAVEARVDIGSRLASSDHYGDLLTRLYGFYEPFEAELGRAVRHWHLPLDADARRKAPLIALDLAALGMARTAVSGVPRCPQVPRPTTPAATLGCLYVTEGATLGGRLIARHVQQRLGFGPRDGASFFLGYGPDTGRRWRTLCSLLAATSVCKEAEDAILAGAIETFLTYDRWLADDTG